MCDLVLGLIFQSWPIHSMLRSSASGLVAKERACTAAALFSPAMFLAWAAVDDRSMVIIKPRSQHEWPEQSESCLEVNFYALHYGAAVLQNAIERNHKRPPRW